jgi:GcrA cell cycle regulator
MTHVSWTDDRVEQLEQLWREGLSASEIAASLGGVTRNAVLGKLHRLKLLGGRARTGLTSAKPRRPPKARRLQTVPRPPARRSAVRAPRPDLAAAMALSGTVGRLEQLGAHVCHWPIGDPADAGFSFCGRSAAGGPYCAAHATVAYRPIAASDRGDAKSATLRCVA